MKKSWILIILIILVIFGVILISGIYNPFVGIQNSQVDAHNSKIDYSCNNDSDCKIKFVGSIMKCNGECDASHNRCVNLNSIEGLECKSSKSTIFVPACSLKKEPNIDYCKCESNVCKSYICFGDNCQAMPK